MSKPGVVLKRAAGSSARFAEHADLPDIEDKGKKSRRPEPRRRSPAKVSDKEARNAAAAIEHEQKQSDAKRRKEEAAREKERVHREKAVAKAQAAFDKQREHEERAESLEAERARIEQRLEAEEVSWETKREMLGKRCAAPGNRPDAGLTTAIPCAKNFRPPLETFFGLPNFFGVAIARPGRLRGPAT
jgi:hypothetical protein